MNAGALHFDRALRLEDLLPRPDCDNLWQALTALSGGDLALLRPDGSVYFGLPPGEICARQSLDLEVDSVGELVAGELGRAALPQVAVALGSMLELAHRYRMAADLHTEVVVADYQDMQRRNAELAQSEAKYRELAQSLEQRVKEQVNLLDERQRQLYQAEKLVSIGQLAAGVAHEINNPMGFIRSNLSTARNYLADLAPIESMVLASDHAGLSAFWRDRRVGEAMVDFDALLKECIEGADRVARIVRDLRGFSSIDRPEEAMIDLNETLEQACSLTAPRLPSEARLITDFEPLPKLLCVPAYLGQAFLSILINAAQAIGDGGEVRVSSAAREGSITVLIGDSGCGMSEEIQSRVFDPFFTTRPVGQGTGLGLTVARDIIRAHGGEIALASQPGLGTTVTVHLPL